MPVFKAYCNGITIGVPPTKNDHARGKRGTVNGWSESATRRNTAFLYSVDATKLTGHGYALTLTTDILPPTSDDWSRATNLFKKRIERMNLIRYHWVNEWQRRGVPHLHAMVYFNEPLTPNQIGKLKIHWIESVHNTYGGHPQTQSQTIKPVSNALGWAQYLGKHGSRGLRHYQRANKPKEWEKTGRMWSKGGDWPTNVTEGEIDLKHFHALRRLAKRYRIADARSEQDPKARSRRITYARNMLKNPNPNLSRVTGVSEWIPQELIFTMLLASQPDQKELRHEKETIPCTLQRKDTVLPRTSAQVRRQADQGTC